MHHVRCLVLLHCLILMRLWVLYVGNHAAAGSHAEPSGLARGLAIKCKVQAGLSGQAMQT